MSPIAFNFALVVGLLLIGAGVAMKSIALALVVVGLLILAVTFATAHVALGLRSPR